MFASVLLTACSTSGGGPGGVARATPAEAFSAASADLEEAVARHGLEIADAPQTMAIRTEEDDFWQLCQDDLDLMGDCMEAFDRCRGMGGMMGAMHDWAGWMSDLWDEMADHHDAMAACATVSECHALEDDWQHHVADLFDQMGDLDPAWPEDCPW